MGSLSVGSRVYPQKSPSSPQKSPTYAQNSPTCAQNSGGRERGDAFSPLRSCVLNVLRKSSIPVLLCVAEPLFLQFPSPLSTCYIHLRRGEQASPRSNHQFPSPLSTCNIFVLNVFGSLFGSVFHPLSSWCVDGALSTWYFDDALSSWYSDDVLSCVWASLFPIPLAPQYM